MTTDTRTPPATAGGPNVLRLVLGTVCLVLGIAVLTLPTATLLVVALVFGIQLFLAGMVRILIGARGRGSWRRTLAVVLGVVTVVAGIICVLRPGTSLLVLIWAVALGWLSDGVSALTIGLSPHQPAAERAAFVLYGIAGIGGAALITTFPGTSLQVFTLTGGVLLVVFGAILLFTVMKSRRRRFDLA